jgi:hypothetical protein
MILHLQVFAAHIEIIDSQKANVNTRKTARLNQKQEDRKQRGKKPPTASLDFQLKENEVYEDMWVLRKV